MICAMTRKERIQAALLKKEVDRLPVSVWMHFSEFDQDPRSLAETMVSFNEKFDYDFIKMMPFGAYSTPDWGAKHFLEIHPNIIYPSTPRFPHWSPSLQFPQQDPIRYITQLRSVHVS